MRYSIGRLGHSYRLKIADILCRTEVIPNGIMARVHTKKGLTRLHLTLNGKSTCINADVTPSRSRPKRNPIPLHLGYRADWALSVLRSYGALRVLNSVCLDVR